MYEVKKSGLNIFHNGAGKGLVSRLLECIYYEGLLVKIGTTTDSVNDWCGYSPTNLEVKCKEDYIKLLSGMLMSVIEVDSSTNSG